MLIGVSYLYQRLVHSLKESYYLEILYAKTTRKISQTI